MKKLVMLISALLMVCLMATACGGEESSSPTSTPDQGSVTSTTTSNEPTSQEPTSQEPTSQEPTSKEPTTQNPPATGAGSEINFSDASWSTNTFFTVGADLIDKTSGGKTAKAGWLNGTVFTSYKQIGKLTTPTYGTKCISFTTTGAATVEVYATRGSSGVVSGDLVLIDSTSAVLATVNPIADLGVYTLSVPAAGSYAITCGSQASSINVFAVRVA